MVLDASIFTTFFAAFIRRWSLLDGCKMKFHGVLTTIHFLPSNSILGGFDGGAFVPVGLGLNALKGLGET